MVRRCWASAPDRLGVDHCKRSTGLSSRREPSKPDTFRYRHLTSTEEQTTTITAGIRLSVYDPQRKEGTRPLL
jgi:hypothetical protein